MATNKNTIIVSDLSKSDTLKYPYLIRQDIEQYCSSTLDPNKEAIQHWSELPGLGRIVIILSDNEITTNVFNLLKSKFPELRVHISESILPRHRSFDRALQAPAEFNDKQVLYEEKRPTKVDDLYKPSSPSKITLFKPDLTIDTNRRADSPSKQDVPRSPTITLEAEHVSY